MEPHEKWPINNVKYLERNSNNERAVDTMAIEQWKWPTEVEE